MKNEWNVKQALFCLIGSTLFTFFVSLIGYHLWHNHKKTRLLNEAHRITSIIQTGPERQALKTAYLAELLHLSVDFPTHLYSLNLKWAEKQLLSSPLIASAKIKRLPPSSLYIDYEVRKPVARLADYENIAIDEEGHFFPIHPFLTPKRLPEIYLGIEEMENWKVDSPLFDLAVEILKNLETAPWKEGLRILRVDVSNALAPSLGQREIVLMTEEELVIRKEEREIVCLFPKILRLAPKEYAGQLSNFFILRKSILEDYRKQIAWIEDGGRFAPRIVDLRIPQLAFVEKG